jgi:N-acetylglucosaminyldiphosphoundecaprenol N-acetyl-beta-D-mannosaminyltransferase
MGGTTQPRGGARYVTTRPRAHDRTVELFGLPIDALTLEETMDVVRDIVRGGHPHQHVSVNAAKVVAAQANPRLAEIIKGCGVVNADGVAVLWAGRVLGSPLPERVAGIDLFERLVEAAEHEGHSVYFLGARHDVVSRVVDVFRERHPRLVIAGFRDGYWQDDAQVICDVRRAKPDYLFVAIPSPRKEFWLNEHLVELGVPFAMGVGGSFDVVAGVTRRAPKIVQRAGLEWAWRLAHEPRRMWRRYLVGNFLFVRLTVREWWRSRG